MALELEAPPMRDNAARHVTVVHFTGRKASLDEHTLCQIHDKLLALADEPGEPDLLLDFGNVDYVSGAALGMLVRLHKQLLARGRNVVVGNLTPQLHEIFSVTGLDRILKLRSAGREDEPAVRDSSQPASRLPRLPQDRWIETLWKGV